MDAGNAFVILARKRRSSKETYTVDGRERTDWRREKIYERDRGICKIMVGIAFIDVVAPKGAVC